MAFTHPDDVLPLGVRKMAERQQTLDALTVTPKPEPEPPAVIAPTPVPEPMPEISGGSLEYLDQLRFIYQHVTGPMPATVPDNGTLGQLLWARREENHEAFYRLFKEAFLRKSEMEREQKSEPWRRDNRDLSRRLKEIIDS